MINSVSAGSSQHGSGQCCLGKSFQTDTCMVCGFGTGECSMMFKTLHSVLYDTGDCSIRQVKLAYWPFLMDEPKWDRCVTNKWRNKREHQGRLSHCSCLCTIRGKLFLIIEKSLALELSNPVCWERAGGCAAVKIDPEILPYWVDAVNRSIMMLSTAEDIRRTRVGQATPCSLTCILINTFQTEKHQ